MMRPIVFDYNNMLDANLGGRGLSPRRLADLAERFREIHRGVARERQEGRLGFFDLAHDRDVAERIRAVLAVLGAERVTLTTDCGMKQLPRTVARAKLHSLAAGAAIVRGELTGER